MPLRHLLNNITASGLKLISRTAQWKPGPSTCNCAIKPPRNSEQPLASVINRERGRKEEKKEGREKKKSSTFSCGLHGNVAAVSTNESKGFLGALLSPSTPALVGTSLSPVLRLSKHTNNMKYKVLVLTAVIKLDAWVIWEFLFKEIPSLSRAAGQVSAFNLSCSLQHTAVCGFWCFPVWSQSVTGFVGGMGQMLAALSTDRLQ